MKSLHKIKNKHAAKALHFSEHYGHIAYLVFVAFGSHNYALVAGFLVIVAIIAHAFET